MSSFESRIKTYRELISAELVKVAHKETPEIFYAPVRYVLDGNGKLLRPILLMLSCKAMGGNEQKCIYPALAVELLHNFTLVHDDIMDNDDKRRGRETVHKKWDVATAILAGDGLVALSYRYLLKTPSDRIREICDIFTSGIIELCEGQAMDKEFETRHNIELEQYISMVEKKTSLLLMMAADIGSIIGGGNDKEREALKKYSKELGSAFQIQDDLLDIELTSGKTFGSDIKQKKKTFLFVHAMNFADATTRDEILRIYQKNRISNDDILYVKKLFDDSGTSEFTKNEVSQRIRRAQQYLNQLPSSESQQDLENLLKMILNRKS